ncbi:MAG: alpha-N-arabinofuranosidase [Oscillospiraceae bacterium]|jgi:alpha-N-arabinofuranosidase|nr:alpha-N-arabinofuranosidase [Oscillospiraceae bacterium]
MMQLVLQKDAVLHTRNPMLYGHFLEHFHRQIYGGVYDPSSPFADADGFRTDVIEALRNIKTPVIRWPGGCFVSAYHWKKGVGKNRVPYFDKAWRMEESNAFGTDEFIRLCEKIGCAPYICTNAGTGDAEEMSDWVEYCNLKTEGEFARARIQNGYEKPYNVKYWSIGNENYGSWEMGAKEAHEWSRLVLESAKMMKRADADISLSAAALNNKSWNTTLLQAAGQWLDWISIHQYWDGLWRENNPSDYETCMNFANNLTSQIDSVRSLLTEMGLEKKIKIAFDEWNLRAWHHPNHDAPTSDKEKYLAPRDKNDLNSTYTMADAVFSACFLNALLRNADIVGMANFAPVVNTRGAIFTHKDGIVKRSTYYVFELYANYMYDQVIGFTCKDGGDSVDITATKDSQTGAVAIAAVNKHPADAVTIEIDGVLPGTCVIRTLNGESADDYNDVGRDSVRIKTSNGTPASGGRLTAELPPHSVTVISFG